VLKIRDAPIIGR